MIYSFETSFSLWISSQQRSDVRFWSQRWKAYIKKVHVTPASPSADHTSLLIHITWAPTILNRRASAGNCTVIQYLHRRGEENIVPGSMLLLSTSIDKCVLKHKIHWPAIMMMVDTELQWFAFYSWCFRDQFGGYVITNDDLVLATLTTSQHTKFRRRRYTYSCVPCLLSPSPF